MSNKEFIRQFINTPISEQTEADQLRVIEILQKYEIQVNEDCPLCLLEKLLKVYNIMAQKEKVKNTAKYKLKEGVNVVFRGDLINVATLTDERAKDWINRGFPISFFSQYPKDEEEEETNNNAKD